MKLHRIIYIFAAVAVALVSGGCTQNNGYIGDLFGSWTMSEMIVDGNPVQAVDDRYLSLSFQSTIAGFYVSNDLRDNYKSYSRFEHDGDRLTFIFNRPVDSVSPVTLFGFEVTKDTMVDGYTTIDTRILRLTGSHFEMTYTDLQGRVFIYKFYKVW